MTIAREQAPGLPSSADEAASRIGEFTRAIAIEALTVKALVGILKGAKKLIEDASREYAERFLFELIQNAYDAHPAGAKGSVTILLDSSEGDHGCLYLANTGTPFTEPNFRAICEIAQSSKQPGQGIGNKGVGFKSVLQVAAWPEIYSAATVRGERFEGYCFRFAQHDDVLRLAGSESKAPTIPKPCPKSFTGIIHLDSSNERVAFTVGTFIFFKN